MDKILRGEIAERLLNDATCQDAMAEMRQRVIDSWTQTCPSRPEEMVRLRMLLQAFDGLRSHLQTFADEAYHLKLERDGKLHRIA